MHLMGNTVRNYAWGSRSAFESLFGWSASDVPQAELWMGTHPGAPSTVELEEGPVRLDHYMEGVPDSRFHELPYLLKVLAAEQPLSIQTHPSKARAQRRFAQEESEGIPRDAPFRNYRDDNHKPELIVALTDFAALCGFRDPRDCAHDIHILGELVEGEPTLLRGSSSESRRALALLSDLEGIVRAGNLSRALDTLLRSRREDASEAADLATRAARRFAESPDVIPPAARPALDTIVLTGEAFPADPGILVSMLLNRVDLAPGDALFLPAGNLHAYLRGVGVEIMASSDNVLRGGLTSKHIDVDELLAVTEYSVLRNPRFTPENISEGHALYRPEVEEFQLERMTFPTAGSKRPAASDGPRIVLCISGEAQVEDPTVPEAAALTLTPGASAFVSAGEDLKISAAEASEVFVAAVPTG
ncbi:mannose-6-phosphate isomerase, class I [Nesterenkonia sp.]|uniref:mannose-6-phosphate isomerase, class I n=1 Tax=Nesterenkonia sp. TaxID=704201 RepID=UPI0026188A11|nr:mannose-6-phosphate isomerase, class I [Nesterenkonia sp.]